MADRGKAKKTKARKAGASSGAHVLPTVEQSETRRRWPGQERSRQTVAAILQAAGEILVRRGYAGATTNAIAKRAGVSIGSLYQYFPDKYAVYVGLLEEHCDEVHDELDTLLHILGREDRPIAETLREVLETVIELHAAEPELHRVLFAEVPQPAHIVQHRRAKEIEFTVRTRDILRHHPQVTVADLDTAAHVLVQTSHALMQWLVHSGPEELDRERILTETVRMLSLYLTGGGVSDSPPTPQ